MHAGSTGSTAVKSTDSGPSAAAKARQTNAVELTPQQKNESALRRFAGALGQPKTIAQFDAQMTNAVRASVGASADAPVDQVFNSFNAQLKAMPAKDKVAFFKTAMNASPHEAGEGKFMALEFFGRLFDIRKLDGNVIPPQTKTAHQFGPSGVVGFDRTGNVPKELNTDEAIVRLAPGFGGGAPGFSFVVPGGPGEVNQSRVLMSLTGDYSKNLSTSAAGLKTEGPEGKLQFKPGNALKGLTLKGADGKSSNDWMGELGQLPAGTVLGKLSSADPNQDWSITVRTGDTPLAPNMMGDRSLRFPRNVRPEGALGWIGWGAAAVVLSPLLLARAAYKAVAS